MHRLACALPLLGVFLGAPACSGAEHVAVNETVHDVLILGAGLAGVSAAAYLLNNSDLDVMILEADSMIGGRVHPIKFGSDEVGHVTIERGANWIQGMSPTCDPRNPARQNPMWNFQCEYGMKGMYVPGSEQEVRGLPVVFNGTLLTNTSDKHLAEREDDTMRAYACAERLTESINDTTVSVQDALNKCGWEAKDDIDDVLQWKVSDSDFAAAASDSSLILSLPDASYTEFGPDDWLVVDQNEYGFSKFVHKIIEPAKAAGKLQLELDTNVTEIDYSHTETIKVVSADGRQFHAKQVIVTFSAGVLRHHHRSMFKPSLDPIQSAALEAVPMANFTKIWLQFPKVWWPDEYKCVLLADTCGQDGKIIPWHNLAHPSAIPGSNALLAIVTGEYAGMLDRLSDSELQSVAMERLKCNYPEVPSIVVSFCFLASDFLSCFHIGTLSRCGRL